MNLTNNLFGIFFLILLASIACNRNPSAADLVNLPAFTDEGVQVVVEIPSGTNRKIEYSKTNKRFEVERRGGKERVVDFLPYPGNYGFIPSTLMEKKSGGDGDPLDVLIISESLGTGSVLAVQPIGTLLLKDDGELDTKIIAVPIDTSLQIITADNFQDFMLKYDAAKRIVEQWFLNYKGPGITQLIRWEDEAYALKEVKKWQVK